MAEITLKKLDEIQSKPTNIRNWTILGTVEHGRLTLSEVLVEKAGLRLCDPNARSAKPILTKDDAKGDAEEDNEQRSASLSLYHQEILPEPDPPEEEQDEHGHSIPSREQNDKSLSKVPDVQPEEYLLNLIDSQGHAEFSTHISSALRISDGALVVVDCIEGMAFETETGLRQALGDRIKPVMCINKLDQGFLELQMDWESFYNNFSRQIDLVNNIVDAYHDDDVGDLQVHPAQGSVAFTAGLHQWGFTLPQFAQFYSKKFKIPVEKMCERLWGDYFFIPSEKQWKRVADPQFRAFNLFILDPIGKIFSACMNDQMEKLNKMLLALGFRMKKQDLEQEGKELLKRTMCTWLPIERALLDMLTKHLPSPVTAQQYRADLIYSGPADEDDECYCGIRDCKPDAPLMLYVSKMVKAADKGRFVAFGRVFAGTAKTDAAIRIMGPNYVPGKKEDLFVRKKILGMTVIAGKCQEPVEQMAVGNVCGLTGIDQFLTSAGTITTSTEAWPVRELTRSTSPVVRCAVQPLDPGNLPRVMDALRELKHMDPMVHVVIEESGQVNVYGPSELHLQSTLQTLRYECLSPKECPLHLSNLVVSYKETVSFAMQQACISVSPNKANRLVFQATPISEHVSKQIENGEITFRETIDGADATSDHEEEDAISSFSPDGPLKARKSVAECMLDRAQRMSKASLAKRIEMETGRRVWAFGPGTRGPNILLDATHNNSGALNEIKESIVASFSWVTKEGVLCEESMRGIGMKIVDVSLHPDSFHRGTGQILPTARRVMYAAQMLSCPRLMEPIYMVEITCSEGAVDDVEECLEHRRGEIFEEIPREGTNIRSLKAYLPVAESFGFHNDLRARTHGQAFAHCMFDHWNLVDGDPLAPAPNPILDEIITPLRLHKGLSPDIPQVKRFMDGMR